jgi:hypothetical protein
MIKKNIVIAAGSGNPVVHGWQLSKLLWIWIPASAGMTEIIHD